MESFREVLNVHHRWGISWAVLEILIKAYKVIIFVTPCIETMFPYDTDKYRFFLSQRVILLAMAKR